MALRCIVLFSVKVTHTNTLRYLEPSIFVTNRNDAEKNQDGPGQGMDAEYPGTPCIPAHSLVSLFLLSALGSVSLSVAHSSCPEGLRRRASSRLRDPWLWPRTMPFFTGH